MLVIYEQGVNDFGKDDEFNIFDCNTYKEMKAYLESKKDIKMSINGLWKATKNRQTIREKYKIYKID